MRNIDIIEIDLRCIHELKRRDMHLFLLRSSHFFGSQQFVSTWVTSEGCSDVAWLQRHFFF